MQPSQLLEALDPAQRQAASQTTGPLAIRAGAGTGKTRTITYRIAYAIAKGDVKPEEILAVTFTKKAAQEMRERLSALGIEGVQAKTFHSAALDQLRYFWPTAIGGVMPQLMDNKTSLVHQALTLLQLPTNKLTVRDVAGEIEWAAVEMLDARGYLAHVTAGRRSAPAKVTPDKMARIIELYKRLKYERNVLDYEDLLTLACGMYKTRPDIAQQFRSVYKYFVVDEYQDISPLQYALLQQWLGPQGKNLCVVGDASQTIYTFAGASDTFLCEFERFFPAATRVELDRNYRCRPAIVELANRIISTDPATAAQAVQLRATREPAERGSGVEFTEFDDETNEAHAIAQRIKKLVDTGVAPEQIAVLFRVNTQVKPYAEALKKLGVPYSTRDGVAFFSRPETRALLADITAASLVTPLAAPSEAVTQAARTQGWTAEAPQAEDDPLRWYHLNTLVELAREKELGGVKLAALAKSWNAMANDEVAPATMGVALYTIHSAKGLEWDHVWIPGLRDGIYPHASSKENSQLAEERRLLYVAVTRARESLHLSYSRARRSFKGKGGLTKNRLSRFLGGIWPR